MTIPVFYSEKMVASITSFSPSAGKPREVMKSWQGMGLPIQVIEPTPVTPEQFYLAHDKGYIDGVLSLQIPNGFGNISKEVASTLPWTSGAMLSAAREAINNGCVAVAPSSGYHHACFSHGGSYCSFNGLMVAATVLLNEGKATHIGILDLDYHYGNGSEDIIRERGLKHAVLHFSAGLKWRKQNQAETFLQILTNVVEEFAGCDLLLYQAGADPHIDDELGGWMTTEQLAERDKIVFETARKIGLPVSWCLAGGYQTPLRKVIDIHDNTMLACAHAYAGGTWRGA